MLATMRSLTNAARAICYATAEAIDRSHRCEGAAERQSAGERAALLTPVAKAFCDRRRRRGGLARHPGPRRDGLHRGDRRRPAPARRQDPVDLRRHQRHSGDRSGDAKALRCRAAKRCSGKSRRCAESRDGWRTRIARACRRRRRRSSEPSTVSNGRRGSCSAPSPRTPSRTRSPQRAPICGCLRPRRAARCSGRRRSRPSGAMAAGDNDHAHAGRVQLARFFADNIAPMRAGARGRGGWRRGFTEGCATDVGRLSRRAALPARSVGEGRGSRGT